MKRKKDVKCLCDKMITITLRNKFCKTKMKPVVEEYLVMDRKIEHRVTVA